MYLNPYFCTKHLPLSQRKQPNNKLNKVLAYLGPGIITAALVFGPGSLTLTSKLGALYQYQLIWVIVVATILMMAFTSMGARIGVASNQSLLNVFRQKWGSWAAWGAGVGIFLVCASFQAGNSIGAGIAFAETFGTSATPWIVGVAGFGISLLFFKSFYKVLEKVMILMVGIMLLSFIITLLVTKPGIGLVVQGLIPSIPPGSLVMVIALVASSFSIAGAFYQSYLVQEKGWKKNQVGQAVTESFIGILILGTISAMILVSAGAVLFPQGIQVNTATDMGKALEPVYGSWASQLFMLGLFGSSFSSLIGNATIGGTLFADALSWGKDLNSRPVKLSIMMIILIGAGVAILFGRLPLELIVFAQGVTIFVVPFIGLGMLILANDRRIMGNLTNSRSNNILGIVGLLVLFGLAIGNFIKLFL